MSLVVKLYNFKSFLKVSFISLHFQIVFKTFKVESQNFLDPVLAKPEYKARF
jgi:hypothetical protein